MSSRRLAALAVACGVLAATPARAQDSLGREFWLAELSASPSHGAQFGVLIVVANPGASDAHVTIENVVAGARSLVVPPGGFASTDYRVAQSNMTGIFTEPVYRVRSDVDVGVTAFVPSRDMADNDATLVLPVDALGVDHVLAGWVTDEGTSFANFVAVVGAMPGTTAVTLRDAAGALVESVALAQGEMYQRLEGSTVAGTLSEPDDDMTGWRVTTSQPAAVFAGIDCVSILGANACDHVDDQVPPSSALASRYLCVPTRLRPLGCASDCAPDVFRLVALEDATSIATVPDVGSGVLAAGAWLEVVSAEPFVATASAPVAAWQYLVSHEAVVGDAAPPGIGDPALLSVIPVEHFVPRAMAFAHDVPPPLLEFTRDFLRVVAPVGAVVTIDDAPPGVACEPVGTVDATSYCALSVEVADGGHVVAADAPIGVTVIGFSDYSSYMATAARGLRSVVVSCDAGSPILAPPCAHGAALHVEARCPDDSTPRLSWSSADGVTFDDASSPSPIATLPDFGSFGACVTVSCPGLPARSCCTRIDASPGVTLPLQELSPPGSVEPLLVSRDPGGIRLAFEAPPAGAGADVLEGHVASLRAIGYDHAAVACDGAGGSVLVALPAANTYWLIAAGACARPRIEGPTGRDSMGSPRPAGAPGCP